MGGGRGRFLVFECLHCHSSHSNWSSGPNMVSSTLAGSSIRKESLKLRSCTSVDCSDKPKSQPLRCVGALVVYRRPNLDCHSRKESIMKCREPGLIAQMVQFRYWSAGIRKVGPR